MLDDKDRVIRDFVVLTPLAINPRIIRPGLQAANFELKPMMFQILQIVGQFNGRPLEDPYLHLKLFFKVSECFQDC